MKKIWRRSLAVVLAVMTMFASMSINSMADNIDLDADCTLLINASDAQDIVNADVVLDVYKVAAAKTVEGYDTYAFAVDGAYSEITDDLEDITQLTTEDWTDIAQKAAKITLKSGNTIPKIEGGDGAAAGTAISVEPGLYFVVARSASIKNYVTTTKDEEGNEIIVTIAQSPTYEYLFKPEIVAVPYRISPSGEHVTYGDGDWNYRFEATMKASQELRFGNLQITKQLDSYVSGTPATFVFSVKAERRGETVYDDVVGLTFDGAGSKNVYIEGKIPAGADVTVTEVYSGVSYSAVGGTSYVVTIPAPKDEEGNDACAFVSFENDSNGNLVPGSGIVNQFEYVESDNGFNSWVLVDNQSDNSQAAQ